MENFVSIILPCRNEEKYISKCLDSILSQNYPKESLEVLVVDGASTDNTRKIVSDYLKNNHFIKLIDNPKKITPSALNIGIKQARGEIIIRMDVHAVYSKDYVSKCVYNLLKYKVDNAGGIIKTMPSSDSLTAKAISVSLSNNFGALSDFRVGAKKPVLTDTVFGGCYRKEVFDRIGLFNEDLKRSQDMEFNLRLKRNGGKILLVPDIISYYYPKDNILDFLVHNFNDGIWAIYPLKFTHSMLKTRHYFPLLTLLLFAGSIILGLLLPRFLLAVEFLALLYFLLSLYFSLRIAIKERKLALLFLMPAVFFIRHFFYSVGSLIGLVKIIF